MVFCIYGGVGCQEHLEDFLMVLFCRPVQRRVSSMDEIVPIDVDTLHQEYTRPRDIPREGAMTELEAEHLGVTAIPQGLRGISQAPARHVWPRPRWWCGPCYVENFWRKCIAVG